MWKALKTFIKSVIRTLCIYPEVLWGIIIMIMLWAIKRGRMSVIIALILGGMIILAVVFSGKQKPVCCA